MPSWSTRRLVPLLLAVAALHGWLLGGARLWFHAGHDFTAPDTDAPTWQTRVVPALSLIHI